MEIAFWLLLAPFRDPFAAVCYRGTTLAIARSAPRLSMICPLQGHRFRSRCRRHEGITAVAAVVGTLALAPQLLSSARWHYRGDRCRRH